MKRAWVMAVIVMWTAAAGADTLRVATWNVHNFGDATLKTTRAASVAKQIDALKANVIVLQELRSKSALDGLAANIGTMKCDALSAPAGRTSTYQEIYGICSDGTVKLEPTPLPSTVSVSGKNQNVSDVFSRPPAAVKVTSSGGTFYLVTLHTEPEYGCNEPSFVSSTRCVGSVADELTALETMLSGSTAAIVIAGDLNADCSYYPKSQRGQFATSTWAPADGTATNSNGARSCAYDRFILNQAWWNLVSNATVYWVGVDSSVSDHKPVYVDMTWKTISSSSLTTKTSLDRHSSPYRLASYRFASDDDQGTAAAAKPAVFAATKTGAATTTFTAPPANEVYASATGLTANATALVYLISRKLANNADPVTGTDLETIDVAVPNRPGATPNSFVAATADATGAFEVLMWAGVSTTVSSLTPEVGDGGNVDPAAVDCQDEEETGGTAWNCVCHAADQRFATVYGTSFQFVIDVDRDNTVSSADVISAAFTVQQGQ